MYSPKQVRCTHRNKYDVLTKTSTMYSPKRVRRTDIAFELVAEEPFRAMKKYRAYDTHNVSEF